LFAHPTTAVGLLLEFREVGGQHHRAAHHLQCIGALGHHHRRRLAAHALHHAEHLADGGAALIKLEADLGFLGGELFELLLGDRQPALAVLGAAAGLDELRLQGSPLGLERLGLGLEAFLLLLDLLQVLLVFLKQLPGLLDIDVALLFLVFGFFRLGDDNLAGGVRVERKGGETTAERC
jgi:hypothetical protein